MHEFDVPFAATDQPVCIIGTGYVGLTAGACLAFLGHTVVCTDASRTRVESLRRGEIPFLERQLPELVRDMVAAGRLSFSTDNIAAAAEADFVFLCLPTPQGADGSADLSAVCEVAEEIGPHLRSGASVVNKSTVPVGTAGLVATALNRPDVSVVSNPEFLAEGTAVSDFLRPDRVVIGSENIDAAKRVAALYERLDTRILVMDAASAETVKYAANTYLAVRLSFVNSMAAVCEAADADVLAVLDAVGSDHRIGPAFLKPGPGWGGSCFPKDTAALIHSSNERGYDFTLLRAAVDANEGHHHWVAD
jgi:UDPglucose 6-dehydrogenase